jgi:hypothetical protein
LQKSFTITRAEVEASTGAALMTEIVKATGSETEAASVLRSLERLGVDPSIDFYEITQLASRRINGAMPANAWRVRADRGAPPIED